MKTSSIPSADLSQVTAFRMAGHHLSARLPAGSFTAAGACGIQNTPPGSAGLALYARVAGVTPEAVARALIADKTLLQAWSLRTAPTIFPTPDTAVFTLGLLPLDDAAISDFTGGVDPALERIGLRGVQALSFTRAALLEALDGQALTKDELGIALARRVEGHLSAAQLAAWRLPSWYAPGQSLGESVVRFMLPVVALHGNCCHAERRGNKAYLRRTDQWLGAPLQEADLAMARAELVRRYLRCYGPSTVQHFAEWAGIGLAQAAESWKAVQGELAPVNFLGKPTWLLREDLARLPSAGVLAGATAPAGLRFLPPHDPYLQLRDRTNLVPDPALRREIWRTSGNPGVILADGQVAGLWRTNKQGQRLKLNLHWTAEVAASIRAQVEDEANGLAVMLNCARLEISQRAAAAPANGEPD